MSLSPQEEQDLRRRRPRTSRVYLGVSIALAAAAAFLLHGYVEGAAATGVRPGPEVSIVVARTSIDRGQRLTAAQLRSIRVPAAYAPVGALRDVAKAAGRVALAGLAPGEAVTETRLARVRAGPVASLVPQGLRAFAVPTTLPRGSVAPGDHVDVLATYGSGQPHTERVAEGLEILFVLSARQGSQTGAGPDLGALGSGAGPTMNLIVLVSPDQEERLAYARAVGILDVAIAPAV